jgi:hypothetical protein
VEEAGVPRDAFAVSKEALFRPPPGPRQFLDPELRRDYARWLAARRWQFVRSRTIPPSPTWDRLSLLAGVDRATRRRLHRYVIHWAVDRAKELYPAPVQPTEVDAPEDDRRAGVARAGLAGRVRGERRRGRLLRR